MSAAARPASPRGKPTDSSTRAMKPVKPAIVGRERSVRVPFTRGCSTPLQQCYFISHYTEGMARQRKFEAHFIHRGKWWVGWTDDIPGALTQGKTLGEARENLKDAVRLMLEPLETPPKAKT